MPIPTREIIRRPFLESLSDGQQQRLTDSVSRTAQILGLTTAELDEKLPSGRHGLFYDRFCWARWGLVLAGFVSIPSRGYTQITDQGRSVLAQPPEEMTEAYLRRFPEFVANIEKRGRKQLEVIVSDDGIPEPQPDPHVWIEKTIVANRPDRLEGDLGLGKALWSPQRSKDGADIYRFMRDVAVGDIILHLTDNQGFTGISQAASLAEEFDGVTASEWGAGPSYRIKLTGHKAIDPALRRETFFAAPFRDRLVALIEAGQKNLFYNSAPALNQGAYLTPAPSALVRILNDAYRSVAGRSLVVAGTDEAEAPSLIQVESDATLFNELVDVTFWTEAALSAIIGSIRHPTRPSRQIILAGPPGTSKTFVAQELARYLTKGDESRSHIVQFHPSYSYEQFIEGLRPTIVNGAVQFKPVNGIVLELAEKCADSDQDHFLIIDEFNRANLPRVLGELMYLFEYRNRTIDLPYTRNFSLPKNLFFIATMNTADRNIRSIDIALRRRFDVFECPPDPEVLRRFYVQATNRNDVPDLVDGFIRLNEELTQQLDEHHTVGHAFFMAPHFTSDDLEAVWKRKIEPVLAEYFFASPDLAKRFTLAEFWPSAST